MNFCLKCASALALKYIDGAQRLACTSSDCDFVYWNNPVPVIAALVGYDGTYVIARNVRWPESIFSVITGYLEQGETPEQAVVREVSEELGLIGNVVCHIGNYIFLEKNQLILCYEVQATGDIITNHELAEVRLLLPAELSEYDFGPLYITKQIIADWRNLSRCT